MSPLTCAHVARMRQQSSGYECGQGQALPWVKKMEEPYGLACLAFDAPDLIRQLTNAVQYGIPALLLVLARNLVAPRGCGLIGS